jgi:hypothetical protein
MNKYCKKCGQITERWKSGGCMICGRARAACYHATHRDEESARRATPAFRADKKAYNAARNAEPKRQATKFVQQNPECSPYLDAIIEDISSGLDWEGSPRMPGVKYHKEHNHTTGEYYGHVPVWLNHVFNEDAMLNWQTVLRYAKYREVA